MLRNTSSRLFAATAAVALVLPLAACGGGSNTPAGQESAKSESGRWAKTKDTIVFGATPDQAGSDSNSRPLEDYIAKKTGYKVEYYPTADYTSLIAAAAAGKIDVMNSGALQYVMAVNKGAKLDPVAATITSSKLKEPGYYSTMVVPANSPISTPAEAKGKKVCFVDPNSTSGFLFGLYQLSKGGLNVEPKGKDASGKPEFADFSANFAGAHDKSAQSIAAGQCEVGFAEDTVTEPMVKEGKLKEIGREYVPGGPLSISTELPADAKKKVTEALQTATVENIKAEGISTTPGFDKGYFGAQAKDKSYYSTITDLCSKISVAKCNKQ